MSETRLSRRKFVALSGASVAELSCSQSKTVSAKPEQKPNILVFFTDQQRWDTCGCYGNPMNLTPELDKMAARGTLLKNSFSVQPVCAPARGSFQTGLFGTQHGVWRNGIPLDKKHATLAGLFGKAGYYTGYIGKWHLASVEPVPEGLRGGYNDYWLGADALEMVSHPYDLEMFDSENRKVHRAGYRVDAETDYILDFINDRAKNSDRPFFLFASFLEPHHQNDMKRYVAPDGYADRYRDNYYVPPDLEGKHGDWQKELPDYYGICACIDENLGRVLRTLEQTGLDKNTVVMFCSDHASHFRTRNGEYKRSCHEDSIHIPTVFQGPGFNGGHVLDELICTIDWTATLLDIGGVKAPKEMSGRSILPLLQGKRHGWPEDVFIQISESQVGRSIRTKKWKYAVIAPGVDGNKIPDADRYVEDSLYDLENDPYETHNLANLPETREIAKQLLSILKRRMKAAGEPEVEITI